MQPFFMPGYYHDWQGGARFICLNWLWVWFSNPLASACYAYLSQRYFLKVWYLYKWIDSSHMKIWHWAPCSRLWWSIMTMALESALFRWRSLAVLCSDLAECHVSWPLGINWIQPCLALACNLSGYFAHVPPVFGNNGFPGFTFHADNPGICLQQQDQRQGAYWHGNAKYVINTA